ncbi:hypothetical protein ACFE04_003232 [Oxalis oulophora]
MSQYENHGAEYGNPIQTDQHGNPLTGHQETAGTGLAAGTGVCAGDYGHHETTGGLAGTGVGQQQHHGLQRSGSSSSSSSEDDGFGGRRKKKGVTQKIKEKIPGTQEHGATKSDCQTGTTATTTTPVGGGHVGEKKGVMEKIKEKLPGGHRD